MIERERVRTAQARQILELRVHVAIQRAGVRARRRERVVAAAALQRVVVRAARAARQRPAHRHAARQRDRVGVRAAVHAARHVVIERERVRAAQAREVLESRIRNRAVRRPGIRSDRREHVGAARPLQRVGRARTAGQRLDPRERVQRHRHRARRAGVIHRIRARSAVDRSRAAAVVDREHVVVAAARGRPRQRRIERERVRLRAAGQVREIREVRRARGPRDQRAEVGPSHDIPSGRVRACQSGPQRIVRGGGAAQIDGRRRQCVLNVERFGAVVVGVHRNVDLSAVCIDRSCDDDAPVGEELHIEGIRRRGDALIDDNVVVGIQRQSRPVAAAAVDRLGDRGIDGDVARRRRSGAGRADDHVRAEIQRRVDGRNVDRRRGIRRSRRERDGPGVARAARHDVRGRVRDRDALRIEQPSAGRAVCRSRIDGAVEVEEALARRLDESAVAAGRAAARSDVPIHPSHVVGPDDDLAAIASPERVGAELGALADVGEVRGRRAAAAVSVAADQNRAAARRAVGRQACARGYAHLVAQHLDSAARRRFVAAAHIDLSAREDRRAGADETNDAAAVVDARSADHAFVVDDVREHVPSGAAVEHDLATVGLNRPRVAHGRARLRAVREHGIRDLEIQQPVAVEIQSRPRAGAEIDLPQIRHDESVVGDTAAEQSHGPARGRFDQPVVHHETGVALRREDVVAGREVLGRQVERARDERSHVDLRSLAEDDPVRIYQVNAAVGVQCAEHLARVLVEDAIQCHGRRGGLIESDALVPADVEGLPIDTEPLAALRDDRGRTGLGDRADAAHDLAAFGSGHGRARGRGRSDQRARQE